MTDVCSSDTLLDHYESSHLRLLVDSGLTEVTRGCYRTFLLFTSVSVQTDISIRSVNTSDLFVSFRLLSFKILEKKWGSETF